MTLAVSRVHNDYTTFRRTYATAYLFGAPYDQDGKRHFAPGGPLGDAILFALVTAPRRTP